MLTAAFLFADQCTEKTFIFILIKILYCLDCKISDKANGSFLIDINIFLNIAVNIVERVHSNKLRNIDNNFVY